jgi:branched-chain amino acid transport system permease protein
MEEFLVNLLQYLIQGISTGSVYALLALGYTMVYGILKLINFAHGDVYMIGAYTGYFAASYFFVNAAPRWAFIPVLLSSMAFCAVLGILIEKAAYKPLRQKPSVAFLSAGIGACLGFFASVFLKWDALLSAAAACAACGFTGRLIEKNVKISRVIFISAAIGLITGFLPAFILRTPVFPALPVTLLSLPLFSWAVYLYHKRPFKAAPRIAYLITAIGVSLFLEYAMMYWQTPDQKYFPPILKDIPIEIRVDSVNSIFIFSQHIIFFSSAAVLSVLLWVLVKFTRIGRGMRAVSFDADAARLMGVNVNNTISFTFAVGSALAGAAGVLFGAFYPFDPLLGIMPGLKAFIAAVLGGIGSMPGAMLGGILMGIAEQLAAGFGNSSFRDVTAFIILIGILLIKPGGLLGRGTNDRV